MTDLSYCQFRNFGSYLINLQPNTPYRIDFVRSGECVVTNSSIVNVPGHAVNNIYIRNDSTSGTIQYSFNAENLNAGVGGFLLAGKEREIINDEANLKSVNIKTQDVAQTIAIEVFI